MLVAVRSMMLAVVSLVVLFSFLVLETNPSSIRNISENNPSQTDYESLQLFPDPTFNESPDVMVLGNSNEFSYDYSQYETHNEVTLAWDHTAGVALDFPNIYSYPFECNDHILLRKSFTWDSEVVPKAVNITSKYRIHRTGSFLNEPDGSFMFQSVAWVSNSLDFWTLGFPFQVESRSVTEHWWLMQHNEKDELFGAIVENDISEQITPDDTLTIYIDLSPSWSFQGNNTDGPWNEYNGTVSLTIEKFEMEVLIGPDDTESLIEPEMFRSWGGRVVDFNPRIETMPDGTVYVLGNNNTGTIDNGYILGKFDNELNEIFKIQTDGSRAVYGEDIAVDDEFVYICGNSQFRLSVLKLTHSGTEIWDKLFQFEEMSYYATQRITVSSGDIYVTTDQFEVEDNQIVPWEVLTKIDSNGESQWNRKIGLNDLLTTPIVTDSEGNIYTLCSSNLTKWAPDGERLWNIKSTEGIFHSIEACTDGSIVVSQLIGINVYSSSTTLIKYSESGDEQWSYSPTVEYIDDWKESIHITDIESEPQGSLYLLLGYSAINPSVHIQRLESDGSLIADMTVSSYTSQYDSAYYSITDISVPGNNYIYTVGMNWSDTGFAYGLRMYYDSTYYSPLNTLIVILPLISVIGLVIILVTVDRLYFKKNESIELQAQA